jgi:hypothetical protein
MEAHLTTLQSGFLFRFPDSASAHIGKRVSYPPGLELVGFLGHHIQVECGFGSNSLHTHTGS